MAGFKGLMGGVKNSLTGGLTAKSGAHMGAAGSTLAQEKRHLSNQLNAGEITQAEYSKRLKELKTKYSS